MQLKVFKLRPQKRRQELVNGLTHAVPALLSIAALGPLIILALLRGNQRHVVGFSAFGLALVFLFSASTVMHFHRSFGAVRAIYGFLDHVGICLTIAGTYTPFCLVTLHGPLGWGLLIAVWSLALITMVLCFLYGENFMQYGNYIYLGMGWLVLVAIKPLAIGLTLPGLGLLAGGGLSYTIGVGFLVTKRHYHYHAIWHVFVGLGAMLHLATLIFYVLPDLH
jgi:hemolysin III